MPARNSTAIVRLHPYQWLWEPLQEDPSFVLRAMFGAKAVYLDGRMVLCFCAREEPWRGVLVCTEREHHAALILEFPELAPHSILPKWLYLPEAADAFEHTAEKLLRLARGRDPRIGIIPPKRKTRKTSNRQRADRGFRP